MTRFYNRVHYQYGDLSHRHCEHKATIKYYDMYALVFKNQFTYIIIKIIYTWSRWPYANNNIIIIVNSLLC